MAQKIERTSKGLYRTRVYLGRYDDGKIASKTITAPDKRTLRILEAEAKSNWEKERNTTTFQKAFEQYIEAKRSNLSPSTILSYTESLKVIEKQAPWFSQKPIDEITEEDFNKLIQTFKSLGNKKTTIKNKVTHISIVLGYNSRKIRHEPIDNNNEIDPDDDGRIPVPSEEEVKKMVELSKGTDLEIPILLAAFGPLRRGEICGLQMSDIQGDTLYIQHNMVRKANGHEGWVIKTPKTKESRRYITMPHEIIELIEKQGYVTHLDPNILTDHFRRFLSRNGLPAYHFHSLRHFAVTFYHSKGYPDWEIQHRGGWKTTDIMRRIYWSPSQGFEDKFISQISNDVKSLIG